MKGQTVVLLAAALSHLINPWSATLAPADTITVDFENTPLLPQGVNSYYRAGPMQTITVAGKVTITGGVLLGDMVNFPGEAHATWPNVYATASRYDPTYLPTVTMEIDPGFHVNKVTGYLFNGQRPTDYTVEAFNGSELVDSQFFADMLSGANGGFGVFSLTNDPITKVVITPEDVTDWNFAIDTVTFVPEPATLLLLGLGVAMVRRRR